MQLKRCWENMKTQRKKELCQESTSLTQTGGDPPLGGPSSSSDVIDTICPHINYKVPGVIDSNTIEILDNLKTTNFENVENPNEKETGLTVKRKQKFEFFDLQESIEIEMNEVPDKTLEHVLPQLKKKCTKDNRSTSASSKTFLNETKVRIKRCCLNIEQDQALQELRMQREQILIEREKNLLQFEKQMQNLQLEKLKLEIKLLKKGIIKSFIIHICSIIAAANPIGGRYDASLTFSENVNLSEPILSRFDILCVVRDEPDPMHDSRLARFVLNSHIKHHPTHTGETLEEEDAPDPDFILPQDVLKKYIVYAKQEIHPKLEQIDQDKIGNMYTQLRQESLVTGSLPITVRHIESVIRMSEAHVRMHLRTMVSEEDVNLAIRTMLETFVDSQKYSVMRAMRKIFQKYLSYQKDHSELLYYILRQLTMDQMAYMRGFHKLPQSLIEIAERDLLERARQIEITDLKPFYDCKLFKINGFIYDAKRKVIVHVFPQEPATA